MRSPVARFCRFGGAAFLLAVAGVATAQPPTGAAPAVPGNPTISAPLAPSADDPLEALRGVVRPEATAPAPKTPPDAAAPKTPPDPILGTDRKLNVTWDS